MTEDEIALKSISDYDMRFGPAPMPYGIDLVTIGEVLQQQLDKGEPLPKAYNWWADLPPGADAQPQQDEGAE
jgi:hypothetical protein